ncbi:MAG: DUF1116 domain-containing protein [Clostridiales bacterium]|nr:DUF1116 domain-containing protein [Clostridiales bacterium]
MNIREKIEQANQEVMKIMLEGQPTWVDVQPAGDVIPNMQKNMILYAGPVIAADQIVKPVRVAISGAAVHDGLAKDMQEAWQKVLAGEIVIDSGQNYGCACGAAMAVSASMPVIVVRDTLTGACGFCTPHPGGKREVLRWGYYDDTIEADLCWFRDVFCPALGAAVRHQGGINLKEILARTAGMGDENHTRQPASSMACNMLLISALTEVDVPQRDEVIRVLAANDRFFLHIMMAGVQSCTMAMKQVPYSTVLAGLGGNGVELGIQVSGMGNQWFTAPAPKILGMFINPTWTEDDILGFLGDSCVTEVYGLGGFSAIAGPAYVLMTGGTFEEARRRSDCARSLSLGEHRFAPVPWDEGKGLPVGIDVRRVVALNKTPISHGGSTLKDGGQGGSGCAVLPMEMFKGALAALGQKAMEDNAE